MRRIVKKRDNDYEVNLNIAPFVDIIFAILIVFMVPSQTLFGNVKLELPPANAKIAVLAKDPVKILIDSASNIIIDNKIIPSKELVSVVNKASLKDKNIKIYVMADKRNSYEKVIEIVAALNNEGFKDVVLITDLYNRL